ncbi:phosphoglycerate dehydrogenase [Ramlibacter sp. USB13]|uniref:D-3-phosphoglycerate dehydrogenase n=1 Tax=Ramlibacter cellulosilyticus TaxID=2764187 RepID=A0A923S9R9_9BURK|nr:phosphoglycerate dehydrogenase [Ramlibacter cellulosilyticus]MBC5782049.1 phosphoglycerate dehydrogenase [Ramlibacter cellulosilyticus]
MAEAVSFGVLVLNQISKAGLERLPAGRYLTGKDIAEPDAILVRSADLHGREIPASVQAVARAGAGTNNIPVPALSARGVPVFNAPGGNANAVKELVLAGMLMAARRLGQAQRFVDTLDAAGGDLEKVVEEGKKAFAGFELCHQTLGVIGLGKVGALVADAAIKLGMHVTGYDPDITVEAAWSLPSQVQRATSVEDVLKHCLFVTLHVPLVPATRHLVGAKNLPLMQADGVLLNFSREGVVDDAAVLAALDAKQLGHYVCDFPNATILRHPGVIALPHLGASTREAEDNCAVMVADQLRDYLEHGNIRNAVNFPDVRMGRGTSWRVAIANANVPNMLGQISTAMAQAGLNIHNMVNKSRGEMAYTLVDVDSPVGEPVLAALRAIEGVLSVRYLPQPA